MRYTNPPYYISAYALAKKQGFSGSLDEWLESLTAFYLAKQAGYTGTAEQWIQKLIDPMPKIKIGKVTTLDGGSMATVEITGTPEEPVFSFGIPRGLGMGDAMPLAGGTMKGAINMNNFRLAGLPVPVYADDAATKNYADTIRSDVGEEMKQVSQELNSTKMAAEKAESVGSSAAKAAEEAQSTADGKTAKHLYTVNLTVSGWAGDTVPYTQTVEVPGIIKEDEPHYGVMLTGDMADKLAQRNAFALIDELDTDKNSVTFTCLEGKPDTDLAVRMEVFR